MGGGLWLCRRLEFHVIAQIGVIISLSTNSTDDCPCSDRLGRYPGGNLIKILEDLGRSCKNLIRWQLR